MTPCRYRSPLHESFRPHRASGKKVQTSSLLFLIAAVFLLSQENLQGHASTGRPPNQDERELIVDRQSSQLLPEAAYRAPWSLPVLMDGEQSPEARSLTVPKRAAWYDKCSPGASTSIAEGSFFRCPLLPTN